MILLVLLGICQEISGKPDEEAAPVVFFCLLLSGITLFLDYLKKRKK